MNTDIQFLYKYQAGARTIDGSFPIYNFDLNACKLKELKLKQKRNMDFLYEGDPPILLATESQDDETIEILAFVNDTEYSIYIE
jgi:hypothetical protein